MNVLAIDDDPVSRLIIERALAELGHDCLIADDGISGWKLFLKEQPDVVISDWMMPDMDGLELCRRIRATEGSRYCYFIMVTCLDGRSEVLEGMAAGVDDYLTKPLVVDELEFRLIAAARLNALHIRLAGQQAKLEALNDELKRTARMDALTGLGNRLRLKEDLTSLVSRIERYGGGLSVGILDIDFFKKYNDIYGHLQGDLVLRAVADQIASQIRGSDSAYRFGGEEFVCLFPTVRLDDSRVVLERIRKRVQSLAIPHEGNPPLNLVTISGGVAIADHVARVKPELILETADQALYRAKARGRNLVEVLDEPDQDRGSSSNMRALVT